MHRLGLVSVSFRDKTPEEILSAVMTARLTCVEWGSDVHAPKDNYQKLKEIAELQKKYGIECCSYGTYFRLGVTPIEELQDYINAAEILGTDILRLWCGNKDASFYTESEKQELFDVCRTAASIAVKNGVTLCMECHNGTFTNTKESALELMQAVNSDSFRMYWQPNQYITEEENIDYAAAVAPFTEHIHVFNWKGEERFRLSDGISCWKKYLKQFKGVKTLLLEFMPDDCITSLNGETKALMKITEEMI